MRTIRYPCVSVCVLLSTAALAQSPQRPAPPNDDPARAALVAAVRAAHGAPAPGEGTAVADFRAGVVVTPHTRDVDSVAVRLDVTYLAARSLVRFALAERGTTVELGRDRRGFWHRDKQGNVSALGELGTETEIEDIRRYAALCRQLLRFLDPAVLIEGMTDAGPVEERTFKIGARTEVPCRTIRGRIASMPVFHRVADGAKDRGARDDGAAFVRLYFSRKDDRLTALEIAPIRADGTASPHVEQIRITGYSERAGRAIPDKLWITTDVAAASPSDARPTKQIVEIKLDEFRPDAGLRAVDLDRPR